MQFRFRARVAIILLSALASVANARGEREPAPGTRFPPVDIPFVANAGEIDSRVALYARTRAGSVFVEHNGEVTYALVIEPRDSHGARTHWALKQHLLGARQLTVTGREPTVTKVRHLVGAAAEGEHSAPAAPQATY